MIVVLQCAKHPVFQREGDNLFLKVSVDLVEALCGLSRPIQHLDGRTLVITRKLGEIVQPGI